MLITFIKMLSASYEDIFIEIGKYLTDKEKITFTMTSAQMDALKYKFTYCELIDVHTIINLPYYDNFENIKIHDMIDHIPKKAKQIHYKRSYGHKKLKRYHHMSRT